MSHPYTVTLVDAPEVPSAVRIQAETRYAAVLERALGGPEAVVKVYRSWMEACESSAEAISAEAAQLAVRWPRAAEQAQQAAFQKLGAMPQAHFELRLVSAPVA